MISRSLGELCLPVLAQAPTLEEGPLEYVDLSAVDASAKTIVEPRTITAEDAPSRARQRVRVGDVLVSTVRPNLNGVAQVPNILDGAVASTGFTVLRADPDLLDARYLFHWVTTDEFVRSMVLQAKGASYPAVSDRIVKGSRIPLPPLPEQRRIAALLDEADSIRQVWFNMIKHLEHVEESILQAILDRTESSRRRVRFGEIVESSQLGLVRGANDFGAAGDFGYLRMDAITHSGRVDLRLVQRTDADAKELARTELRDGDLLFNTRNSRELVGKSAVFYGPAKTLFNNNILRLRFKNDISPAYIAAMLRTGEVKSQLEARKRGTTSVFAVYYRDLASIELEIPSTVEMAAFEANARRVQDIRLASEKALTVTEQLKTALRSKAFRGEL